MMGKGKGSGFGKKGVSLSWLLGAVIMVFVVLTVKPAKDIAFAATENTAKVFGIPIGNPRIGSFSAAPVDTDKDNKWEMKFDLSVSGNKDNAYLEIYESKASDDKTATQLEPPPAKFGDDDRIYSSLDVKGALADLAKKGVFVINCPEGPEKEGCSSKYVSKSRDEFNPDLYKFSVVIRKEKGYKVVYSKDAVAGFYDEAYFELLNKKIAGCRHLKFNDCNVLGIFQKGYLKTDFLIDIVPNAKKKSVVGKLNKKLVEKYPATKCKVEENGDLKNEKECTPEDLMELYTLAVFEAINFKGKEYSLNVFNCEIPEWKTLNPPKRPKYYVYPSHICDSKDWLRQTLASMGWLKIVQPGWKETIQKAVDSFADNEGSPAVTDIKAVVDPAQPGKLHLMWSMPVGKNNVNVDVLQLQHWKSYYVVDFSKIEEGQPQVSNIPVQPPSYYFDPAVVSKVGLIGQHMFRFTAWPKDLSDPSVKIFVTGAYDRNYIERYSNDVEGCKKTYGVSKSVESIGCNVIDGKINVFIDKPLPGLPNTLWGSKKLIPREAFHKFREAVLSETGKEPDCVFDWEKSKLARSDGSPCSPEHVDRLYNFLIAEASSGEILGAPVKNCGDVGFSNERFFFVCTAKDNLIRTLKAMEWSCTGEGCPNPGVTGGRPWVVCIETGKGLECKAK